MDDLGERLQAALSGSYRVEKELGGGGMSRVFVAEDTELARKVVVKVLPPDLAAGLNVERFRREIQLAARLQHPHIVPLLAAGAKDGLLYYTMPLIGGETLRAKLARSGELPIADAVRVLREVADALEYAHSQGVVHRDIKPENILFAGHHALVTDFGVSKALSSATGEQSLTSIGVALGTPTYMSPEQATADPNTDHRTDIYALGILGYELLTGRPPFSGATPQQILAAQVTEPAAPVTAVRQTIPPALAAVVMRCLEKRPADRWQSAEEVRTQLESLSTPSGGTMPVSGVSIPQPRRDPVRLRRRMFVLGGTAVAILLAALIAGKYTGRGGPTFTVGDTRQITTEPGLELTPALSPDGRMVAYYSDQADALMVRQVAGGTAVKVADGGFLPHWSPDGAHIVYSGTDGVYVVPALGGAPRRIFAGRRRWGAVWSPDGARIAYLHADTIFVADANGSGRRAVTVARDPHSIAWSPDGKRLAYVAENSGWVETGNIAPSSVWVVNVDGSRKARITGDTQLNTSPAWTEDGSGLLFVSGLRGGRDIYYQRVPASGSPSDPPQRITSGLSLHRIAVAPNGRTIVYSTFERQVSLWSIPIPTSGQVSVRSATQLTSANERIEAVSVTRDGEWLAFDSDRAGNHDIYKTRASGGEPEQLTRSAADEFNPAWSPNGDAIAFHSWRSGNRDTYVVNADGSGERLIAGGPSHEYAGRFSPDGHSVLYASDRTGRIELYVVDRNGGAPRQLTTTGAANLAEWSPDGRWITYANNRGVQVIPAAGGTPRTLVTRDAVGSTGLAMTAWSPDSRTIYFRAWMRETRSAAIAAVQLDGSDPRVLVRFDDPNLHTMRPEFSTDGRRFYFALARSSGDLWVMDMQRR